MFKQHRAPAGAVVLCFLLFSHLPITDVGAATPLITNADFSEQSGEWADGDGPPGWTLSLDRDDQLGIVKPSALSEAGGKVFYFNALGRGFGDARIDQCVPLSDIEQPLQLSVGLRSPDPDPELALRLRLDFFADERCDVDSITADETQVGTDIGLSEERLPPDTWTTLRSAVRLPSALSEDVRAVRVSVRIRDRSDDGQPRHPPREVWLDQVSLDATLRLLPAAQRQALRDLYRDTQGPEWRSAIGWMGAEGSECQWEGIQCSDDGAQLLAIDLSANGLQGELPSSLTALSDLQPGEGLALCWNTLLVPEALNELMAQYHVGGDPAHCQGLEPLPTSVTLTGLSYQALGRDGEGFNLQMLGQGAATLFWASYDDNGEPLWVFGSGRASQRVFRFDDLYLTQGGVDEALTLRRVGRAQLAVVNQAEHPDCREFVLRFSVNTDSSWVSSGRVLQDLDPSQRCGRLDQALPAWQSALTGAWFDVSRNGEGISLIPYGSDRLVMTWYGYDETGAQQWRLGVSDPIADPDAETIEFPQLQTVSGGNFDGPIQPADLTFRTTAAATLEIDAAEPRLQLRPFIGPPSTLPLTRIAAGPDLLASTGMRLDLTMAEADLDELYTRDRFSDDRLPGSLGFNGGAQQPLTGLRFRGSSSRFLPKKSFNIRFENPQPLLFDSDRMNLNAMYTDPSLLREALSFQLFRQLGQPASNTRHADLWINDIYEGTYVHIQRVDETLLSQSGLNPEGTLIRDRTRDNEAVPERSIFSIDPATISDAERAEFIADQFDTRGDADWAAVQELVEWVWSASPSEGFKDELAARIDLDNFLTWWSLHWLIGDIDAYADDYWLYLDSDDPEARWLLLPWDKDLSFGSHFRAGIGTDNDYFFYEYPLSFTGGNRLFALSYEDDAVRAAVHAHVTELMADALSPQRLKGQLDDMAEPLADSASLQPSFNSFQRHPQNHHGAQGQWQLHIEAMKAFIDLRQSYIATVIEQEGQDPDQRQVNAAAITLGPLDVGRHSLTDEAGWTLAWVDVPSSSRPSETLIELSVTSTDETQPGIDRVWTLSLSESIEEVPLTLFYRNEISDAVGREAENWWTEDELAISNQTELVMVIESPGQDREVLPTRTNPYANMATATVSLAAGEHQLRLLLVDED